MSIRSFGIEKGANCTKNDQFTSRTDRFIAHIRVNYVTWITKISNSRMGQIVCPTTYEYSCLELGKILVSL